MEFQITGQHIDVTPTLRETIEKKCKKLEQYFDHINGIHIVLKVEKIRHIVEATMKINGGELHASSEEDDMYAAIDSLVDKLARQVNKHKEKIRSH